MSEKQNRGIGDLSKYDTMTTEELEEILRLDAQAPKEQESDTEIILYIMEVLTERKRNNGHTGKTALEAYESFKQNYMPAKDNNVIPYKEPVKIKKGFSCWIRSIAAVAAVLVILVLGSVTAKALGFNIWDAVVKWTQETFHFGEWGQGDGEDPNPDKNLPFNSLQEALKKGNADDLKVPQWVPEGYVITAVKIEETPSRNMYYAIYENGDHTLRITVQDYLNGDPIYVEQSEGLVEEYKVSGITYYLFKNNERTQAEWIVDSFECRITGELTIEELKIMINSIEKG